MEKSNEESLKQLKTFLDSKVTADDGLRFRVGSPESIKHQKVDANHKQEVMYLSGYVYNKDLNKDQVVNLAINGKDKIEDFNSLYSKGIKEFMVDAKVGDVRPNGEYFNLAVFVNSIKAYFKTGEFVGVVKKVDTSEKGVKIFATFGQDVKMNMWVGAGKKNILDGISLEKDVTIAARGELATKYEKGKDLDVIMYPRIVKQTSEALKAAVDSAALKAKQDGKEDVKNDSVKSDLPKKKSSKRQKVG